MAQDIWNLFDGICFDSDKKIVLLQMKTNAWAKDKPFMDFIKKYKGLQILSFNVSNTLKECKGKYKVFWKGFQ